MAYTLFLSHSVADHTIAHEVKCRSEAAGISVYTYEDDVRAGSNLAAKLIEAIRSCDGLVALLTKNGAARPAVQQEIGVAMGLGKPVYALVEPGVDPATLTLLQGLEYIHLELDQAGNALLDLQKSITHQRDKQRAELLIAIMVLIGIAVLVYVGTRDQ